MLKRTVLQFVTLSIFLHHTFVESYAFSSSKESSEKYVVYPKLVESRRFQRDLGSVFVHYEIELNSQKVLFDLIPNLNLINENSIIERRKSNAYNSTIVKKAINKHASLCYYEGSIRNHTGSTLGISICNGMVGLINFNKTAYLIEPVGNSTSMVPDGQAHVVYKAPQHTQLDVQDRIRAKRSENYERVIGTLVVADRSMFEFYQNDDLEAYLLTIMNMVAAVYRYASLEVPIHIQVVRLVILENDSELEVTRSADDSLEQFCQFQNRINTEPTHPLHHDVGILATRVNICSKTSCQTLGLAHSATLCNLPQSCNINEDNGIYLAFTIAHELAHNLNATHDEGICARPHTQYIMSSHLTSIGPTVVWSNCSRDAIADYLYKHGDCLKQKSADGFVIKDSAPMGLVYDSAHQCRLFFGDGATLCTEINSTCSSVWCEVDNNCALKPQNAFEGTLCDNLKDSWCIDGKCVKMRDVESAVNGEWSGWSEWSKCSRNCGGGVRFKARKCDNPLRGNNGHYCKGSKKRYEICNTQPCLIETDDPFSFHKAQCRKFSIPERNIYYEYVYYPARPCELYCASIFNRSNVKRFKDHADNGTPCQLGTKNLCVEGTCKNVGCDWNFDSNYDYDYCGVCGGDNSTCKTVYGFTNFSDYRLRRTKYYPVILIPAGARNVKIVENTDSYLAVKDLDDIYYINGQLFINTNINKNIDGTIVSYNWDGFNETVYAKGPTTTDLFIMLLYQKAVPQVFYEYTLGKEASNVIRTKDLYYWNYTDWSHCSKSCGRGLQNKVITCFKLNVGMVPDEHCKLLTRLEEVIRPCNTKPCHANWWVGEWQHCSSSCKDSKGLMKRSVLCVYNLYNSSDVTEMIPVPETKCKIEGLKRPMSIKECSGDIECKEDPYWIVEEWTDVCSTTPCGTETREIRCSDWNGICDINKRPISQRQCPPPDNVTVCGEWVIRPWWRCSQTCGGGNRTREYFCPRGKYCGAKAPHAVETCNNIPCPGMEKIKIDDRVHIVGNNQSVKTHNMVNMTKFEDDYNDGDDDGGGPSMQNVTIYKSNDFIERVLAGVKQMPIFDENSHMEDENSKKDKTFSIRDRILNDFFADLILVKVSKKRYLPPGFSNGTLRQLRVNNSTTTKRRVRASIFGDDDADDSIYGFDVFSNRLKKVKHIDKPTVFLRVRVPKRPLVYKLEKYENINVKENTSSNNRTILLTLEEINALILKYNNQSEANDTLNFQNHPKLTAHQVTATKSTKLTASANTTTTAKQVLSTSVPINTSKVANSYATTLATTTTTVSSSTSRDLVLVSNTTAFATTLTSIPTVKPNTNDSSIITEVVLNLKPSVNSSIKVSVIDAVNSTKPNLANATVAVKIQVNETVVDNVVNTTKPLKTTKAATTTKPTLTSTKTAKPTASSNTTMTKDMKTTTSKASTKTTKAKITTTSSTEKSSTNALTTMITNTSPTTTTILTTTVLTSPTVTTTKPTTKVTQTTKKAANTTQKVTTKTNTTVKGTIKTTSTPRNITTTLAKEKLNSTVTNKVANKTMARSTNTTKATSTTIKTPLNATTVKTTIKKVTITTTRNVTLTTTTKNGTKSTNTTKATTTKQTALKSNSTSVKNQTVVRRVRRSDVNQADSSHLKAYNELLFKLAQDDILLNDEILDYDLPHEWEKGVFGPCSKQCGLGLKMRKVVCKSKSTRLVVPDMYCLKARPRTIEKCNEHNCSEWKVTPWSACSKPCGKDAIQTRKVYCGGESIEYCDPNTMPSDQLNCVDKPCHEWRADEWEQCSTTCGVGIAIRKVSCFSHLTNTTSVECDQDEMPTTKMHCNTDIKCDTELLKVTTSKPDKEPECIDAFNFQLCSKIKLSNRCKNQNLMKHCCKTCTLSSIREVYSMLQENSTRKKEGE